MSRFDAATHSYVDMDQVMRLNPQTKLPPIANKDKLTAPEKISATQAPHLSPVGSLTNLLTDLSSSGGFKKKLQQTHASKPIDKNSEIQAIMAKNKTLRKDHFKSINSKLFGSDSLSRDLDLGDLGQTKDMKLSQRLTGFSRNTLDEEMF